MQVSVIGNRVVVTLSESNVSELFHGARSLARTTEDGTILHVIAQEDELHYRSRTRPVLAHCFDEPNPFPPQEVNEP